MDLNASSAPRTSRVVDLAGARDLDPLAGMMAASPLLHRYGVTLEGARASLAAGLSAGDVLLVARSAEGVPPIGFAWVVRTPAFGVGAYLRLLLVAEGQHGGGLGARLLEAAESNARAWANHVFLLATSDNDGARRFYERHAYRHVGDLPDHVLPGLDESLYHKVLRPHGERV